MNVFEAAKAQPWLITPEWLRTILEITARENVITPEVLDRIEARREALASRRSGKIDETRYTTKRGSVATVEISGPIVRYADLFAEVSGLTSTQHLALDIQKAIDDLSISAIILSIDSPGGEATGINELANLIYEGRKKKKIVAYAEGFAASAAYWLAAATERIYLDKTAMLGSVGVVFVVPDPSKRAARDVEIVSSQSPKKRPDVSTESGKAEIQRWADELAQVFIDGVALYRELTEDDVLAWEGGIQIGEAAIAAKMADEVTSYEQLVSELGRPRVAAAGNYKMNGGYMSKQTAATAAEQTNDAKEAMTPEAELEKVRAEMAGLRKELADEKAERAKAETERKRTEANAKVDAFEREGKLTGNATAAFRTVYTKIACGEPVTIAEMDALAAALPKFDTTRVAANATPPPADPTIPTAEDFRKADGGDVNAKKKIDAHVKSLVAKDGNKKQYATAYREARAAAFAVVN